MPQSKARTAALMASVDDVEAQFYEALQAGDLERLMAVWADDDEVACVHPGGPRVLGPRAIRASFESIFANGAIPVRLQQVRRIETPGAAVHHVVERVDIATAEGTQTAWVLATNVYLKTAQGWRLVLHHASPGTPREPQELADPPPSTLH
ncbi:MAG TPA: SgcJ/EcaC family oxidoreductase [Burkholderiaceae bacterium]|nr:SgcJ/EcaC family oxidoreductase [Burkholderiaceae bacterium]